MSIRARVRKLAEQMDALNDAESEAKGNAWLRTLSDEALEALCHRQAALRTEKADPEATLTYEQMAEILGMTEEQLRGEIEAAWRARPRQ